MTSTRAAWKGRVCRPCRGCRELPGTTSTARIGQVWRKICPCRRGRWRKICPSQHSDQSTGSYRLVIDWAIDPNFRPGELDRSEQLTRRTERIRTTSTGWTVSNVRIDWTSLTAINLVGMFGNAKWNTCMPIVAGRNGSLLVQLTTRALLAAAGAWWAPPLRCCFFYHQPPSSRVGRVCASQVPWERA